MKTQFWKRALGTARKQQFVLKSRHTSSLQPNEYLNQVKPLFSFTKNEKPLAVGSGSTDLILPLSRVNQHLLR